MARIQLYLLRRGLSVLLFFRKIPLHGLRIMKDMRQAYNKRQVLKVSRTTSAKPSPLRMPKKTFQGRPSVSPLPRWSSNWVMTLGILYLMSIYILPLLGMTGLTPTALGIQKVDDKEGEVVMKWGVPVTVTPAGTSLPPTISPEFYASSKGQELAAMQTQSAMQVLALSYTATPIPTVTLQPTVTTEPFAGYPLSNHKFSFYDPMIGKDKPEIRYINCDQWNDVTQYCDSQLRNGERWEDNYFIAAACPYDLYMAGAYFLVVSPDWLVKLFPNGFTCKDTGEAVTGLFIDFLIPWQSMPMPYENTPWATPITLKRIR